MYKAYKFRLYPTSEQQIALAKSFGCCRWFWNYALNLCQETYKVSGKGLSRGAIQGLLPNLKKEYPWLTDAYSRGSFWEEFFPPKHFQVFAVCGS